MKITVVAGARPNFIKVAPLLESLNSARAKNSDVEFNFVHTGQHYDERMSQAFFKDLELPQPDVNLGVGSGTHAEQTAKTMIAFETSLVRNRPDWVLVVGDVNSTLACALTAKKLGIKVAHVEAGLRSHDWSMPEEINRVLTDQLSDALFTTEAIAGENLRKEGIDACKCHFVGNVMVDTLLKYRERALRLRMCERLGLQSNRYGVITLHRPGNVGDRQRFSGIISALSEVQKALPLVFPIHPSTHKMAATHGLLKTLEQLPNLHLLEPLGYLEMLSLNSTAMLILTDSGGLQEEAVVLGVPCLTLRDNTERPVTVEVGINQLVGSRPSAIVEAVTAKLCNRQAVPRRPDKWDGLAARRIVDILLEQLV